MPQLAGVWEAQSRIGYLDFRFRCESVEHLVNRLLVSARYQFLSQLRAAGVKLRTPLLGCVRLNSLFQLEYVKTVVRFDHRAHVAGPKLLHRFFQHVRELTFVIASESVLLGIGSVRMKPRD